MSQTISGSITPFKPGQTLAFTMTVDIGASPGDVTSDTVRWLAKASVDDADDDAVLDKTVTPTATATGIEAAFEFAPADTATVAAGLYYWELTWTRDSGRVYVVSRSSLQTVECVKRVTDV